MLRAICLQVCTAIFLMPAIITAQNLLLGPAAAVYDEANDRYLIASSENHCIVAIDRDGAQSHYVTDLGSYLFSLLISGDTLYLGDSRGTIRAFDLNSADLLWEQYLADAYYPSGIAVDTSGSMYISDNNAAGCKIYKLDLSDLSYEIFVSGLPDFLCGLVLDEPNRRLLAVALSPDAPVMAVALDDASLTPLVIPPAHITLGGIAMDNDGYVYIANYYGETVYRYNQTFTNPPLLISEDHGYPTGLGYNHVDNILIVPNYIYHTVEFIPLDDTDGDEVLDYRDNSPDTPNPGQEDTNDDGVGDACCCEGIRGNANGDPLGNINISDISYLVEHLFGVPELGPPPPCPSEGNANSDPGGSINISDVTYLVEYLFGVPLGPPPAGCS